jgi:1-phosphofructokinase family hexose kinase
VRSVVITSLALSPSVDTGYIMRSLRHGEINRPIAVHRVPGGKGLNVARAAHALGADIAAVAVIGGATGTWIADELARIGLPLAAVAGAATTRTCVSIADGGITMTEIYEPATPVSGAEWLALERRLDSTLARRPGWLTISGSLPPGAEPGAVGRLIDIARKHRRKVAVDIEGAALFNALDTGVDLLKVNVHEASSTLGTTDEAAPDRLAEVLAERTTFGAVVTAGVAGAYGHCHQHGPRFVRSARQGPYPVGSGDCMLAALVAGLDRGASLSETLPTATATATANALTPGPACFDLADVALLEADAEVR